MDDAEDDECDECEEVLVFWRRTRVEETVDGSAVNALLVSVTVMSLKKAGIHVIHPIIDLVPG